MYFDEAEIYVNPVGVEMVSSIFIVRNISHGVAPMGEMVDEVEM